MAGSVKSLVTEHLSDGLQEVHIASYEILCVGMAALVPGEFHSCLQGYSLGYLSHILWGDLPLLVVKT